MNRKFEIKEQGENFLIEIEYMIGDVEANFNAEEFAKSALSEYLGNALMGSIEDYHFTLVSSGFSFYSVEAEVKQ